jgi:hypothetical protein
MRADWQLVNPGRYVCIGPSQSGKSELVLKLIEHQSIWEKPPKNVQYIAPTLDDREDYLQRLAQIVEKIGGTLVTKEELPKNDSEYNHESFLIVDDVLSFPKKDIPRLKEIALRGSHHNKVTLILTQQVPHPQGEDFIAINKNLTGKFLLYQTSDIVGLQQISWRLFRKGNDFLLYCLYYAKDILGTNYVFVNTYPHTKVARQNMCYTNIFPGENGPYFFDTDHYDWKDIERVPRAQPNHLKVHKPDRTESVMPKHSKEQEQGISSFLDNLLGKKESQQKNHLRSLSYHKQIALAKHLYDLNKKRAFSSEGEKEILGRKFSRQRNLFKKHLSSLAKYKETKRNPYLLETTLIKILPLILAIHKAWQKRDTV